MYLPEIFRAFLDRHGDIADAYRKVGELCSQAGPIDLKTQHLIQLGTAVGTESKGGVRSHARRALDAGASESEVNQVVLLTGTVVGFPSMIAAFEWVQEVITARNKGRD